MKDYLKPMAALALVGIAGAGVAVAGPDGDIAEHQAFQNAAVTLAGAIAAAEAQTGARAMSAEFEQENDGFVYSVELLAADGSEVEVEVDIATAAILEVEPQGDDDDD